MMYEYVSHDSSGLHDLAVGDLFLEDPVNTLFKVWEKTDRYLLGRAIGHIFVIPYHVVFYIVAKPPIKFLGMGGPYGPSLSKVRLVMESYSKYKVGNKVVVNKAASGVIKEIIDKDYVIVMSPRAAVAKQVGGNWIYTAQESELELAKS